ncbi:MAG: phosphotransferase [Candidatus Eremiobacteraeota bacterium]|nr:phosphotransferase [Candidatus Eremiobacteraeota bacterium]
MIAAQFPELTGLSVEPFGNGWDNTAYLVGGTYVFRFPRRTIAVPLIEREVAILPLLAPALPAPIPVPCFAGIPTEAFPWPFAGYVHLAGTTVSELPRATFGTRLAGELGAFLRALHRIVPSAAVARGLPPDDIGRLAHERRFALACNRLAELHAAGVIPSPISLTEQLARIAPQPGEGALCIVHGDLYARHVLVNQEGGLGGVIDWGDVHLGNPALDLAVVDLIFTPVEAKAFFAAYGPADARTLELARYRAIYHATLTVHYGWHTSDPALLAQGTATLERLGGDSDEVTTELNEVYATEKSREEPLDRSAASVLDDEGW